MYNISVRRNYQTNNNIIANKKYSFCIEKVYYAKVEYDFGIDEIRKSNKNLANLNDEELLYNVAEAYGVFN